MSYTDSTGLEVDTLADIGFVLYDLYRIGADNIFGDEDNLGENRAALGADAAAIFVPFATGAGAATRAVRTVAKAESKIWKQLKPFRGDIKTNGASGKKRMYFKWDHTQNDIEVFDRTGKQLGTVDPTTGEWIKPAVKGRSIKL